MYNEKKMRKINNSLETEIVNALNEQIWLENNASFYYLYLSTQFNMKGYTGISTFFLNQSQEEREHMLKIVDYLLSEDCIAHIPNYNFLEDLEEEFNIIGMFENSLASEKRVTQSIVDIVNLCKKLKDIKTENFMQWFITEQREEENKFKDIIDNLTIIGDDGGALYDLNKRLGELTSEEENI